MYNGDPNQPNNPFKPFDMFKSKQMNGSQNPFGFGMQRVAGALAPQRNKSGMPTNTVPLPPVTNHATPRWALHMAGWKYDPATGAYTHNGLPVTQAAYMQRRQEANDMHGQKAPLAQNGNRTGAVAEGYAQRYAPAPQPRASGPNRNGLLGSY
jgi:hypothetical protein